MLQQTSEHVLMSLRPSLVDAFLAGDKCVELRRRAPNLKPGTLVWFYGKVPYGQVMIVARLQHVMIATPHQIWDRFGPCLGISSSEFDSYLDGLSSAAVLVFDSISQVSDPPSLDDLRQIQPRFQPPQFFSRVTSISLLDRLLESDPANARPACGH